MSESGTNEKLVAAVRTLTKRIDQLEAQKREPIAIVGIGCRMPGAEAGPESLWELLRAGKETVQEVKRWGDRLAKSQSRHASLLSSIETFEPGFFEISPREARVLDPQQRLLLEVTYEAVADAGIPIEQLRERRTGVFVGLGLSEYASRVGPYTDGLEYAGLGNISSVAAGRISYVFDFKGPCVALDTACSSGLTGIHLACESLRLRATDVAIAGGVNVLSSAQSFLGLTALGALAPDGRCKAFDASGNGFGRAEGCGLVVLKRLSEAERDGDRIWAVIRGSAINSDGYSSGLTAPNPDAQERVIRAALDVGSVSPDAVQYIEAHGTGTILGDPIEVEALAAVFGKRSGAPLALGAVKTNVGHLEAAAGVAGLIKAVMSIRHRELPASLHFHNPNPHIAWSTLPIRVQSALGPWPNPTAPLVAGVSSFGLSGTNAHVVVEAAPAVATIPVATDHAPHALVISARTQQSLTTYAQRIADALDHSTDTERDIAYTASVRRSHLEHRLSVVGTRAQWAEQLRAHGRGQPAERLVTGHVESTPKLAMVFGGQGTQWFAMGRELLASEPVFRATVEAIAAKTDALASWRLLEELGRDEKNSRVRETQIAQPTLFALHVALFELWRSWGVVPSAVAGHSLGEISAAHVSGALDLDDAVRLVVERGRILQKATGLGRMASVGLNAVDVERFVADHPGVEVAAYNASKTSVITGEPAAVERAVADLATRGIDHKLLRVDYAFHSAQMEPFAAELAACIRSLAPKEPTITMISTVTGAIAPRLDADYWANQVRKPVRFLQTTETLINGGHTLLVEVGAHPVLVPAIEETLAESGKTATIVPSLRRGTPERVTMLEAAGVVHCAGYPLEWSKQFVPRGRVVTLPSYAWNRERFWIEESGSSDQIAPLLDRHTEMADDPGKHVFDTALELATLPLSFVASLALQAAVHVYGERVVALREIRSEKELVASTEMRNLQLVLSPIVDGAARLRLFSRTGSTSTLHATGTVVIGARSTESAQGDAPLELPTDVGAYVLHPAILDAALQSLFAADAMTLTEIATLAIAGDVASASAFTARWTKPKSEAELVIVDANGRVVLRATGIRVRTEARASTAKKAKQDDPRLAERLATAPADQRHAIIVDYLRTTLAKLLGTTEPPSPTVALGKLGIDSLVTVRLRTQLKRGLSVDLPAAGLPLETIQSIATRVLALTQGASRAEPEGFKIRRAVEGETYAAMHGQVFFWSLGKDYPDDPDTNALPLLIEGPLDIPAMTRTIAQLAHRHRVFRTRYSRVGDAVIQTPPTNEEASTQPEWRDFSALAGDEQTAARDAFLRDIKTRPFDIDAGPFVRIGLAKLGEDRHLLVIVIHHIAFDAGGVPGLFRDLTELYTATVQGAPVPELPLQYIDYAASVQHWEQTPSGRASRAYWQRTLDGASPVELPADFPRAPVDARRDRAPLGLAHDPVHQFKHVGGPFTVVRQRAEALGVTPYAVFVATFAKFLQEVSGQTDLCIETLYALRAEAELANMQGMMTNILLTRVDVTGPIDDVIRRTKLALDEGHGHGYARVSSMSNHALRRVSFNYVPLGKIMTPEPLRFGPQTLAHPQVGAFSMENLARPWDVQVMLQDAPDRVMLRWMCSQLLFKHDTAERWFQRFVELLS